MTHASTVRLMPPAWLRLPRRTARLRLAGLCGGLILISGVALLAGTYVLFERATAFHKPDLPRIPQTPSIQPLQKLQLPQALLKLTQAQYQLTQDQNQLELLPAASTRTGARLALRPGSALAKDQRQLNLDQRQLTRDQHQLAEAIQQLSQAVHQVTQTGAVQTAQRATDSHQLLVDSGIALAGVGLLALFAGWLVAGRMLRPIRTVTRTARRISSTNLHERLALDGPADELKELGDTLDDLFARLEAAFEAQRRFVANASHELRTPLARERALVQVALGDPSTPDVWRATGQELLASNREQETLIEALLTLASSESGLDHREPVDLAVIAETVVRDRREADGLGLEIELALAAAPLAGDPRLLERLVANLVDNAITHNVPGGRVRVSTGSKDGNALLEVTNTGPVISATEIDRLFQPFQRLDPRRIHRGNSHGLGLSIVQAIATAHGATITAHPSPRGGVSIEATFPQSARAVFEPR